MRYGLNSGRPTTVIPRAAKPSNTKGKQTYVENAQKHRCLTPD